MTTQPSSHSQRTAWYKLIGPWSIDLTKPSQNLWHQFIVRWHRQAMREQLVAPMRFGRDDDVVFGVIDDNDQPVATGVVCPGPRRDQAVVRFVWVEPEHRRLGLYRYLLEAIDEFALQEDCSEILVDCLEANEASIAAHLALGFRERGDLSNQVVAHDPALAMSRSIVQASEPVSRAYQALVTI